MDSAKSMPIRRDMKRKADPGAEASKTGQNSLGSHPLKRHKQSKPDPKTAKVDQKSTSKPAKEQPEAISILRVEEKSFPRGGANVLTPLERKQISIQATKDVLFEQSGAKRQAADALSDSDDSSLRSTSPKPKPKKKKKGKTVSEYQVQAERKTKIEGLSYKRLVPGTLVLGNITQITSRDIALALPNNLTGYVPLTEISNQLNVRVEKLLEQEDEVESNEEFEDVDLKKMFSIGQYLRAYVTAAGTESAHAGKKRIDLSVNPRLANSGIKKSELTPNLMVQAAVSSVEDHGLVMDLSLEDTPVKGFLSAKDLGDRKLSEIEEGSVFLCLVTGMGSGGRVVKLSIDRSKIENVKRHFLSSSQSIHSFVPGTAVEILITDTAENGLRGQIQGMLDVTADVTHSGLVDKTDKYAAGDKVKARIIFSLPRDEGQALGVSLLSHIMSLSDNYGDLIESIKPTKDLPLSSIVEKARVVKILPSMGLFLELPTTEIFGFAHISNIGDEKIEKLSTDSGNFKVGSAHRARVLTFNAMDGQFIVSLQRHVIEQPFLRIEDIALGQVVKGTVEKLHINEHGVNILVKLADGIVGLVPTIHMADVHLEHPERKFREGLEVKARVLSTDIEKRRVRLTLKKTLVNSDASPWTSYEDIQIGAKSPGTLINVLPAGAVVQFYGNVRGFLPVSEMSEAFIEDPRQHFKIGQVVNVSVLDVDPHTQKMTVSCKNPNLFDPEQLEKFDKLSIGELIKATVAEISSDFVTCNVQASLKAILRIQHLSDGSSQKNKSLIKKLRVGQTLNDLVVLNKDQRRQVIVVSQKPSLVRAAQARTLCASYDTFVPGKEYAGFIRNITDREAFVEFAAGVIGLLPKQLMTDEKRSEPQFAFEVGQSLSIRVFSVDKIEKRVTLTMKAHSTLSKETSEKSTPNSGKSQDNFTLGQRTVAIITGVRATQLNVQLDNKVHGRVDASEVFDEWANIKDRKKPLCNFKVKQEIEVRIIGVHDVKSRRFLPITHRHGPHMVYELSMRDMSKDDSRFVLTMDKLMVGDKAIGIVNNHGDGCVWVSLSPSVRGRVRYTDLILDETKSSDPENAYPIGSAMLLTVTAIDLANNKLDLSMGPKHDAPKTLDSLSTGEIYRGMVTKVSDRGLDVQISDSLHGFVPLIELSDDYDQVNLGKYEKNSIVKVAIADIDKPNKRLYLSLRQSIVSPDSSLSIKDKHITSSSQVKINDLVRGFVKNVAEKGLFISIGPCVTAFVPIPELSDQFIKDWKASFVVDQLVTGKVISIDSSTGFVKMSLKESLLNKDYVPLLRFEDIRPNQIVTAKVREVKPYGVFIVIDDSTNVSGLCHKSEIADEKVEDITTLYAIGDAVKAIVLKVDKTNKRVNFGLKASYFKGIDDEDSEESDIEMNGSIDYEEDDFDEDREIIDADEDETVAEASGGIEPRQQQTNGKALLTGGFDWTGGLDDVLEEEDFEEATVERKKRKKKPTIQEDMTGELDKYGPQGNADFERLLLGQPNNANIWIEYMAFEVKLGELDKAREIAERGLKTINPLDQDEKKNLWIAYLNLENGYGSDETTDEVFGRACEYNDKDEMHEKLVSILIASGKHDRAEDLFSRMTHLKALTATTTFWLNYATFLMTTANKPDTARALLLRASQSVDESEHRALTAKFGALEFRSPNGDAERGRTIFEGLLSTYPRRFDLWDMYVDLERSHGDRMNAKKLFERMANAKMKKQRAKFVFKRWLEFEESSGTGEDTERVKKLAAAYVDKLQQSQGEIG